jgi:hypothetical protein
MIVRVFSEGQYEIDDALLPRLHELDRGVEEAIEASDEPGFRERYAELLELVRREGTVLADDDLRASELILPPPDLSLEEARTEFSDHGLIPD